jgi:hypothetical protein
MKDQETWQRLYATAVAFRDAAPWDLMCDSDLFGVQDPDTGEIGYCCIMGNAGQVFGMGAYLGEAGLASYLALFEQHEQHTDQDCLAKGFSQLMLKAEFVDRRELNAADLAQIKSLGLKFRGSRQWPQFREHRPGYEPWHISAEQARFMTHALEQALEVAHRYEEEDLELAREEDETILVRVAAERNGQWTWEDRYLDSQVRVEAVGFPSFEPDEDKIKWLKKRFHPSPQADLLFSFRYMLGHWIKENRDEPAYLPKNALWIHGQSGMIIGMELLMPGDELHRLEDSFYQAVENLGALPTGIYVDSVMAAEAVIHLAKALDIQVLMASGHPVFKEIQDFMGRGMLRG